MVENTNLEQIRSLIIDGQQIANKMFNESMDVNHYDVKTYAQRLYQVLEAIGKLTGVS